MFAFTCAQLTEFAHTDAFAWVLLSPATRSINVQKVIVGFTIWLLATALPCREWAGPGLGLGLSLDYMGDQGGTGSVTP